MRWRLVIVTMSTLTIIGVVTKVGIGIGKPKSTKHIVSAKSDQEKPEKLDPQGTIDGSSNPEVIPDHAAYTLIFRALAIRQDNDLERRRAKAWAKTAGLDDMRADALLSAVNEFQQQVKMLDLHVRELKDRTWPNPNTQVMAHLVGLQAQKEAIAIEIIASLPSRLGEESAKKLNQHVRDHVKRKIKLVPGLPNLPGRHH